ncbi:MAG: HIRAN domain-containing protein [Pseudomonadota bacterium]
MKSLFVAWQDPKSRQWAPVGRLSRDDGQYHFVYTQGAEELPNFTPFGRMNNLKAEYVSDELFPLFANRILAKSRPEYDRYLGWLGLDRVKYDALDELARTGGLRATDSLELFPCPHPTTNRLYEVFFFSRGLRHLHAENQRRANDLKSGERLYVMPDLQNEFDNMALLLRTGDPITLVGYAPRYFSGEFSRLMQAVGAEKLVATVEKVNVDAPLQYRVLCKIKAPWPTNFQPCQDRFFEPISKC